MNLQKTIAILLITISCSAFAQDLQANNVKSNTTPSQELFDLGMNHFYGNFVPKDVNRGIYILELAGEQGSLKAQLNLARAYMRGYKIRKNTKKAFYWATKAALQNNSEAQLYLGEMYLKGKGTRKDIKKGISWILKSKNQGYAKAYKKWNKLKLYQVNS